jgi:hypothetical protein
MVKNCADSRTANSRWVLFGMQVFLEGIYAFFPMAETVRATGARAG